MPPIQALIIFLFSYRNQERDTSRFIYSDRGKCYEHARDQGTLGSVTGCRHSRTPGGTYDFLMVRGGPCLWPGVAQGRPERKSRDIG
jgi:hypothetical protein